MRIANPKEAIEALKDRNAAFSPLRGEQARRDMMAMCYYEGVQWISRVDSGVASATATTTQSPLARLLPQWNPDVGRLRVTANRVARFIQKAAAATFPQQIDAEVVPPPRMADAAGIYRAQVCEDSLNALIDDSRFVAALRAANFQRCVTGAGGVGLTIRHNQQTGSSFMEAFDFQATNLTLDPANYNADLHRHDYVIYSDIWTADKARRVLGIKLDDNDLMTIGQLSPLHQELARLTSGRLFAQYALYSRTKGVKVVQMHERGDDGLYRQMFIFVEKKPGSPELVNADNPLSPYGGDGMPLILLTGHPRGDKFGWIGDVAMLKDDQDAINLWKTIQFRQAYAAGSPKIVADRRGYSAALGKSPEAWAQQYTSASGSLIEYDSGTDPRRQANPPQYLQAPPPQPYFQQAILDAEVEMREQVHRAELNMGVVKSHVPASADLRARQAADEVFGQRVQNDIEKIEQLLPVALGTTIMLAQQMSPTVLQTLQRGGLNEQDFGELLTMDPVNLPVRIKVRESSIRYRSQDTRKQDLLTALQFQQIGGPELRRAMARDLDSALTDDDGFFSAEAERAAMAVIAGQPWQPMPLGQYSAFFIEAFRRGLMSREAKSNPAIRQGLIQAIVSQQEADAANAAIAAGSTVMGQRNGSGEDANAPETAGLDELASLVDQQQAVL